MPKALGEAKLVLILKIENITLTSDFRPISCCNVIYKCVTTLLYGRLKGALPLLINSGQGVFVKGRELLFNVLLCQEIARGYSRKNISPRCIMKITYKNILTQFTGSTLRS